MNPFQRIKQSLSDGAQQGKTLKELEAELDGIHYGKRAFQFQRAQVSGKPEANAGTVKRG